MLTHIFDQYKDFTNLTDYEKNSSFYPVPFWDQRDVRSFLAGLSVDPTNTRMPLPKGSLDGFEHHNPEHDVARAAMHIQYGIAYANGDLVVPDEIDENSMK